MKQNCNHVGMNYVKQCDDNNRMTLSNNKELSMPFHSMKNMIICSGLLAVSVASAATYYVDAEHGDDKAAGTSAAFCFR